MQETTVKKIIILATVALALAAGAAAEITVHSEQTVACSTDQGC
jgi:hypothetical protein